MYTIIIILLSPIHYIESVDNIPGLITVIVVMVKLEVSIVIYHYRCSGVG